MSVSWLAPIGALGVIALGVIVALHMRHRLPTLVAFPDLTFWPRVPSESRESPRWRKPPLSLLMLLQLLAALAIVLALMRPAVPQAAGLFGQRADAVQHIIVLDGSTSMLTRQDDGRVRWDIARDEVSALLDGWQQGDGVTLVLASASPTWLRAVDGNDIDTMRAWLDDLPVPGGSPDAERVASLVSGATMPDLDPIVTVVTDGGLSLPDAETVTVGLPPTRGNIAIVDASLTGAEGDRRIRLSVLHDRESTETVPWVLRAGEAGGADVATGTVTLQPGEIGRFDVVAPTGVETATVSLVVDDALPEDDRATVALGGDAVTGRSIVLISDLPGPVLQALQVLPGARVEVYPSTTQGIAQIAAGADLVVYDLAAPAPGDLPAVPMLLVQPPTVDGAWEIGGVAPNPATGEVRLDDPVLRDVSLEGVVYGETPVYSLPAEAEVLAGASDGDLALPLIWRGAIESQPYLALAFDPARSTLSARPAFPVLMAQAVDALAGDGAGAGAAPGRMTTIAVPEGVTSVALTDPEGRRTAFDAAGEGARDVAVPLSAVPGRWTVTLQDDDGIAVDTGALVVNVGDLTESRVYGNAGVTVRPETGSTLTGSTDSDGGSALTEVWPLLVLAGLAIVGIEWWVWLARGSGPQRERRQATIGAERGEAT